MTGKDIEKAADILRRGGIVSIPTETVYGLSGNATDQKVVAKIFQLKNRPSFNPLIVHFDSTRSVLEFGLSIPKKLKILTDKFWPGPLTILVEKTENIPGIVTAGLPTVAIRVPNHKMANQLLRKLSFPLAAPSANPFGLVSPTKAEHVHNMFGEKLEYILDGGPCSIGLESTVVMVEGDKVVVLRSGGVSVEDIEKLVGPVESRVSSSKPQSPGQLVRHYSPGKKIVRGNIEELIDQYKNPGILSFKTYYNGIPDNHQRILSEKGDFVEAASRLFSAMRELGNEDIDVILAENFPDMDLGRAINDRLQRASG